MWIFSPILLRGKVLLQMLWNKRLEWDDKIDEENMKMWELIHYDLEQIVSS